MIMTMRRGAGGWRQSCTCSCTPRRLSCVCVCLYLCNYDDFEDDEMMNDDESLHCTCTPRQPSRRASPGWAPPSPPSALHPPLLRRWGCLNQVMKCYHHESYQKLPQSYFALHSPLLRRWGSFISLLLIINELIESKNFKENPKVRRLNSVYNL